MSEHTSCHICATEQTASNPTVPISPSSPLKSQEGSNNTKDGQGAGADGRRSSGGNRCHGGGRGARDGTRGSNGSRSRLAAGALDKSGAVGDGVVVRLGAAGGGAAGGGGGAATAASRAGVAAGAGGAGSSSRGGSRGGEKDGLDTLRRCQGGGIASGGLAAGSLDVEGVGVLKDTGVALKLENEAINIFIAEGSVNVPSVGLGAVLDTSCLLCERLVRISEIELPYTQFRMLLTTHRQSWQWAAACSG